VGGIAGCRPRAGQVLQLGRAELLPGVCGVTTAPPGAGAAGACLAVWLPAPVAAKVEGDWLGDGAPLVPVVDGLGLGDGDPLVLLVDGLGLGELLGLAEGEGLGDADVVLQLGEGDGEPGAEVPTVPPGLETDAVLLELR